MHSPTSRRQFLKSASKCAPLTLLPSGLLRAADQPKLQIGFIGMGGQIQGHVKQALKLGHRITALCDVDQKQIEASQQRHGEGVAKATIYQDYRKLFEKEKSMDAVVIATPDHWHAPICRAAFAAGKHIYCEKPLTHTVAEARQMRELCKSSGVITQMGNQGSASSNLRRSMELIAADLFGKISSIHVWHPAHGWPSGIDRPDDTDTVPNGLNWDFWLGPAPVRPYKSSIYHPAKWRGWYDFGNGSLGDFCCHSFNLPLRALNLDYPKRIEVSGEGLGKESYAKSCTTRLHFPARGERAEVSLNYYTGGDLPDETITHDVSATFGGLPRVGCILVGEKGHLAAGLWNSQCYVKLKGDAKYMGADNHEAAKTIPHTLPRVKNHLQEWADACLGGPKNFADFEHGGHLTEIGLAGNVALRMQQNIEWDGPNMKVINHPEADQFIRHEDRTQWL